jgi:hypothetical protein
MKKKAVKKKAAKKTTKKKPVTKDVSLAKDRSPDVQATADLFAGAGADFDEGDAMATQDLFDNF